MWWTERAEVEEGTPLESLGLVCSESEPQFWLCLGAHLFFNNFVENIFLASEFGPIQDEVMELGEFGGGYWKT
jgi:hypothetical protein